MLRIRRDVLPSAWSVEFKSELYPQIIGSKEEVLESKGKDRGSKHTEKKEENTNPYLFSSGNVSSLPSYAIITSFLPTLTNLSFPNKGFCGVRK